MAESKASKGRQKAYKAIRKGQAKRAAAGAGPTFDNAGAQRRARALNQARAGGGRSPGGGQQFGRNVSSVAQNPVSRRSAAATNRAAFQRGAKALGKRGAKGRRARIR